MVTRSRSSSFLNQEHHDHEDCVDGGGGGGSGGGGGLRRLGRISRSADGRFVLTRDSRSSSLSSTSDDGGFLSHPSFSNRTWSRRPLMAPANAAAAAVAATTATTTTADGSVRTEDDSVDSRRRPIVVATVCGPQTPRGPYRASSPAASRHPQQPQQQQLQHYQPQQLQHHQPPPPAEWYFDLSSVVMPGGPAERTLRSVHEQYSQQLPSLRVIHEENQRTLLMQQQPGPARYHPNQRFRSRHMRYARSAPELTSDAAHMHHHQAYNHPAGATAYHHHLHHHHDPRHGAAYLHPVQHQHHLHHYHHHVPPPPQPSGHHAATTVLNERSPESRSSSSGFGSKNTTSSLQHPNDWSGGSGGGGARPVPAPQLPPYKPPPAPAPAPLSSSLFYANDRWLDLAAPALPSSSSPTSSRASPKPLSVDDQYEFDPIFPVSPTPTDVTAVLATARNTPVSSAGTVAAATSSAAAAATSGAAPSPSSRSRTPTQLKKAKYENVEARLQAMKEEFYAYKRRQAEMARMSGQYVESAC